MSALPDYLLSAHLREQALWSKTYVLQHHQIPWHWESGATENALDQEINGPQCLLMMVDSMGAH